MSTVTARWLSDARGDQPRLLGRAPAPARALRARPPPRCSPTRRRVLIEIGPRATLSALARQACVGTRGPAGGHPVAGRRRRARARGARRCARPGLVARRRRSTGTAIARTERRRRVPLPAYPFERHAPLGRCARGVARRLRRRTLAAGSGRGCAGGARRRPRRRRHTPAPADRRARLVASIARAGRGRLGPRRHRRRSVHAVARARPRLADADAARAARSSATHGVKVTFRQVMERYPTIAALAHFLDEQLPPDAAAGRTGARRRSRYLRRRSAAATPPAKNEDDPPAGPQRYDVKKAFGAIARIHTAVDDADPAAAGAPRRVHRALHRAHRDGRRPTPPSIARSWPTRASSTASGRSPRSSPTRS